MNNENLILAFDQHPMLFNPEVDALNPETINIIGVNLVKHVSIYAQ
jgi:hypothetical protein